MADQSDYCYNLQKLFSKQKKSSRYRLIFQISYKQQISLILVKFYYYNTSLLNKK